MAAAWIGGVGVGLGWGVVLGRQLASPGPCVSEAPASVVVQSVAASEGRAPRPRRLPRGVVCYPPRASGFELPPVPEAAPAAIVTTTELAHRGEPVAEPAEEAPLPPPPAPEPVSAELPLDPHEVARAEAELAAVRAYAARTAEIEGLAAQAQHAESWVLRAIMAQELARLQDPRVIAPLAGLLTQPKERDEVCYFVLLGLADYSAEDLRRGGGAPLARALIDTADARRGDVREQAYRLLRRLSGQELPARPRPWEAWLQANADALGGGLEAPTFDEASYDPRVVARVRTGGGTRVREPWGPGSVPRDPVFSEIFELRRRGLDLVVCLDQTSSMEAVIQSAKQNLSMFTSVLGALVEHHRLGLVVYKDGVTGRLALGRGAGRFKEALLPVWASGGGDVPEGVDKALVCALQGSMGWRHEAAKVVVLVGDAPPHAADVPGMLQLGRMAHAEGEFTVHAVDCGGLGGDVAQLARDTGGAVVRLTSSDTLIYQILGLVFGDALRPAVERFLDTYLQWAGKKN